ncbi:MAG: PAS domain-containing protein [Proteobacteria bacterium]|nr:PAS domain-containing protein [Pseudomonadota bacterium]
MARATHDDKLLWFTGGMFGLLLLLAWLNEVLDLPQVLLSAPSTPINWRESLIESVVILIVGLVSLKELRLYLSLRRAAEEALRRSEEKYRTVADYPVDWETWEDPHGRYVYVSPSCLRITGRSREEFIERPELVQEIVSPEDREAFSRHQRLHVTENEMARLDFRIVTSEGEERWISHICQPVYGRDGVWLGRRSSNRDISIRMRVIGELEAALAEVKVLRGLIPICANCKRIRDDEGYWRRIEEYIEARSEAQFTHGLCQDCIKTLYPELSKGD